MNRVGIGGRIVVAAIAGVLGTVALHERQRAEATGRQAGAVSLPFYDGPDFTPRWRPVDHRIGAFRLVTQEGETFRDSDLDGRIHVASFLFTTCPNLCPMLVQRLRPLQDAARDWPDVRLVSFSVTPTVDTPSVLAEFGRLHRIDPARWILLSGDAEQIDALARRSYFADDARVSPSPGGSRRLLHTEKVLLVDQERRLRGVYDGTQPFEIERLLGDIAVLRAPRAGRTDPRT